MLNDVLILSLDYFLKFFQDIASILAYFSLIYL